MNEHETEECSNCKFARNPRNLQNYVQCHYAPPRPEQPAWPTVEKINWCGRYEPCLQYVEAQYRKVRPVA